MLKLIDPHKLDSMFKQYAIAHENNLMNLRNAARSKTQRQLTNQLGSHTLIPTQKEELSKIILRFRALLPKKRCRDSLREWPLVPSELWLSLSQEEDVLEMWKCTHIREISKRFHSNQWNQKEKESPIPLKRKKTNTKKNQSECSSKIAIEIERAESNLRSLEDIIQYDEKMDDPDRTSESRMRIRQRKGRSECVPSIDPSTVERNRWETDMGHSVHENVRFTTVMRCSPRIFAPIWEASF